MEKAIKDMRRRKKKERAEIVRKTEEPPQKA